jgi:hypothetical protein
MPREPRVEPRAKRPEEALEREERAAPHEQVVGLPAEPRAFHDRRMAHPTAGLARRSMLSSQGARLGNQAAQRLLGAAPRRAAEEARTGEDDPIVTARLDFGPYQPSNEWSYTPAPVSANPFASRAQQGVSPFARRERREAGAAPLQRLHDAEAGGVFFTVTSFNAAVAGGLQVTEGAGGVTLDSQTYTATGTVEATGPKSRVGLWDVGFLQTVYQSSRNFYYKSAARTKSSDICTKLPVRDGDTLIQPWYGMETVSPFAAASPDTQTATMSDTPGTNSSWDDPVSGEAGTLDHTDGQDVFRSWLAVRNRSSFHKKYLRFADWQVDYSTAVDTTQPIGSRVTPGGAAGATVTGTGNGMGGKQPELFDPVANAVAKVRNAKW